MCCLPIQKLIFSVVQYNNEDCELVESFQFQNKHNLYAVRQKQKQNTIVAQTRGLLGLLFFVIVVKLW
jgi:hypothetical protein